MGMFSRDDDPSWPDVYRLNDKIKALKSALQVAKEKLEIYRKHSDGNYQGGMEHISLIKYIDEVLNG